MSLLSPKHLGVGVDAAGELVELRVLVERIRIDVRRTGVAVAANLLRLPVGFRLDDDGLPFRVGPDAERKLLALRPVLRASISRSEFIRS